MIWSALDRYGVDPAPEGLAFVQDLIDTIGVGKPRQEDLLTGLPTAQPWLDRALFAWAAACGGSPLRVDLAPEDLEELRDFREDLRRTVGAHHGDAASDTGAASTPLPSVALSMQWDEAGRVRLLPRGTGWRKVASLVAIEAFKAQQDGSWSRLKTCRNSRCAVAFYDRSRNNSGVWHDVKVCGNAANLRAYRARRRVSVGEA